MVENLLNMMERSTFLVRHGKHHRLDQLLDLFVEAADVRVLLRGPSIDLNTMQLEVRKVNRRLCQDNKQNLQITIANPAKI